jgi:hypothetical protein
MNFLFHRPRSRKLLRNAAQSPAESSFKRHFLAHWSREKTFEGRTYQRAPFV